MAGQGASPVRTLVWSDPPVVVPAAALAVLGERVAHKGLLVARAPMVRWVHPVRPGAEAAPLAHLPSRGMCRSMDPMATPAHPALAAEVAAAAEVRVASSIFPAAVTVAEAAVPAVARVAEEPAVAGVAVHSR
jgi:hypothetical protein